MIIQSQCPAGVTGWTSESFNDADGDGCRDADEDIDVDGDGLIEIATGGPVGCGSSSVGCQRAWLWFL